MRIIILVEKCYGLSWCSHKLHSKFRRAGFVPFIMLLAGLVVRMKFRDAASAAITLGVAFVGMSMLIGFMVDAIGVAAQTMMQRTGLELSIVDGGWTTMANISGHGLTPLPCSLFRLA